MLRYNLHIFSAGLWWSAYNLRELTSSVVDDDVVLWGRVFKMIMLQATGSLSNNKHNKIILINVYFTEVWFNPIIGSNWARILLSAFRNPTEGRRWEGLCWIIDSHGRNYTYCCTGTLLHRAYCLFSCTIRWSGRDGDSYRLPRDQVCTSKLHTLHFYKSHELTSNKKKHRS